MRSLQQDDAFGSSAKIKAAAGWLGGGAGRRVCGLQGAREERRGTSSNSTTSICGDCIAATLCLSCKLRRVSSSAHGRRIGAEWNLARALLAHAASVDQSSNTHEGHPPDRGRAALRRPHLSIAGSLHLCVTHPGRRPGLQSDCSTAAVGRRILNRNETKKMVKGTDGVLESRLQVLFPRNFPISRRKKN